jgi:hypothetical protein
MKRHNGRKDVYWVARQDAVKAGYEPRTIKLSDDPGEIDAPIEIAAKCRRYWAEMLEFLSYRQASEEIPSRSIPVGTIEWLIELYQSDEESPYKRIRPISRIGYDKSLEIIRTTVGARRIDALTGKDVRKWFRLWGRADGNGDLANPRRAYGCIQLLRIIVSFGAESGHAATIKFAAMISEQRFQVPKKRKSVLTREQVVAFIAKAKEAGSQSMAIAVSLQFACGLRQNDVIGQWERTPDGRQWQHGLLWGENIDSSWRLTKATSKSHFDEIAEFDLRLIPMVLAELKEVASDRRTGPVVVDEHTGRPYIQREFARRFRLIARQAGIPDTVWNMDARAGAITDAYNKGAEPSDIMDLATHKVMTTNRGYKRGRLEQTSRVSKLRFGKAEGTD